MALALIVVAAVAVAAGGLSWWRGHGGEGTARPVAIEPNVGQQFGANVDLLTVDAARRAAVLDRAAAEGITWLRQAVLWSEVEAVRGSYDWAATDDLVAAVAARGMNLIVVLEGTPAWARPAGQEQQLWTPPRGLRRLRRLLRRLRRPLRRPHRLLPGLGRAQHLPALGRPLRGRGRLRAPAARGGQPHPRRGRWARILLAGLAPNVENGPLNLNEAEYLRLVYAAGGAAFFDVAAAKPYGFEYDPGDEAGGGLAFRRTEALRAVMEANGDAATPLWAVEFGWSALPAGWQGQASPWPTAEAGLQAGRGAAAVRLARDEWPWMGPLLWAQLTAPAAADDPRAGFALFDAGLQPTALGAALLPAVPTLPVARAGYGSPDAAAATYSPGWRVGRDGADPSAAGDSVEIRFSGTAIDLLLRPGPYWAVWYATVDGRPAAALPQYEGRSYVVLYDPLGAERWVTVARGLGPGVHTLRLEVDGGWQQWPLAGWLSWRERPQAPPWALPLAALGAVCGVVGVASFPGAIALARALLAWLDGLTGRLPAWLGGALVAAVALAFWFARGLPANAVLGVALALVVLAWPAWGAALVAASLPFFLLPKQLPGVAPSLTELTSWLLLAVMLLRRAVGAGNRGEGLRLRLHGLDLAVLLLVVVSLLSLAVAANYGVAATEFRRVILSAAVFYTAVRLLPRQGLAGCLAAGFIAGAVLASLWGIRQSLTGAGLIEADGVGRVRAAYGSPNNLALYLERVIPLAGALALYGGSRRRRLLSLALLAVMLVCGALTRSRGLILLALPVSAVYLAAFATEAPTERGGWLHGRRWLLVPVAVALVAVLALATGRVGSLLSGDDQASGMRLQVWRSAVAIVRDHPLLGIGLDNFLYEYRTHYILPTAWHEPNLSHPHDLVLDAWTRLGVGGLAAILWLFVGGWWAARRAPASGTVERAVLLGIEAAIVGAVAHGLVDNSFFLVDLSHALLGMLALVAVADPRRLVDVLLDVRAESGALAVSLQWGGTRESVGDGRRRVHRVAPL